MTDGQYESRSTPHRYLWPAELDLMAQLAGMTLSGRWADWQRAPYTGDSESHISVWRRTAEVGCRARCDNAPLRRVQ